MQKKPSTADRDALFPDFIQFILGSKLELQYEARLRNRNTYVLEHRDRYLFAVLVVWDPETADFATPKITEVALPAGYGRPPSPGDVTDVASLELFRDTMDAAMSDLGEIIHIVTNFEAWMVALRSLSGAEFKLLECGDDGYEVRFGSSGGRSRSPIPQTPTSRRQCPRTTRPNTPKKSAKP